MVTASNRNGSAAATSAATGVVTATSSTAPPSNSSLPTVSGTAQQGQTLTTTNGTWSGSPTSYTYDWTRCDTAGGNCAVISGTKASSYTLTSADVNHTLRAYVNASNAAGTGTALSAATGVVTATSSTAPPSNSSLPTVSGTAQQGLTLTTTNGTWSGSPTSYTYEWTRCDTAGGNCAVISGSNAASYTLTSADVNNTLRAYVNASNAAGTGTALSAATGVVTATSSSAPPSNSSLPTVSGTAQQGQTLTTTNGTWSGSPTSYTYDWTRCDTAGGNCAVISGSNAASYTLTSADVNHTLRAYVNASNAAGTGTALSAATGVVTATSSSAPPSNSSLPTVSGTAQQGLTLTTTNGTWSGSPTSYTYDWTRCDTAGGNCAVISGSNAASYTLTSADVNHTLRAYVNASNAAGTGTALSAATGVVTATSSSAPPSNSSLPTVSGTAQQGQTLTTTNGTWSGSPTSYTYDWTRCDTAGGNCAVISGSNAASYTLTSADVNHTLRAYVNASNAAGTGTALSAATGVVTATSSSARPSNGSLPTVSGTAQQGLTLTTTNGTWSGSPTSYTYDWTRCDTAGGNCAVISGSNAASYTLTSADVNHTLRAYVNASNAAGTGTALSAATGVVTATSSSAPPSNSSLPTVSGTAQQGLTLTTTNGTWSGSPTSYTYDWTRCDTAGGNCAVISGSNAASYTLTSADVNHTLRAYVNASNAAGTGTALSAATGVVTATSSSAPPSNSSLPTVSGTAQQGQTLTTTNGTWSGSPTSYTYDWTRCDTAGGNCAVISGSNAASYTLTSADVNHTLRAYVNASNAAGTGTALSAATGVVTATSSTAPPSNSSLPTVSGTAQQGQTLTTTNGTWSGSPTSYTYDWTRCDTAGGNCAVISGSNAASYTLTSADVNHTLRAYVNASNAAGTGTALSAATGVVTATSSSAPPSNSSLPTVSGTAQQGQTLTTTNGTWSGSPTSYTYDWTRCDTAGGNCAVISGTKASSYTLTSADVNHTLRAYVNASNAAGTGTALSAATGVVTATSSSAPPSNSSLPTVSGTAQQGQTLTTTNGTWTGSPTSYTYDWTRCDTAGTSCAVISGTKAASYTLTSADVNHTLRAYVNATNSAGTGTALSAATGVVTATSSSAPPSNSSLPTVSGTAQQGLTLTTTNGTWSGSPTSYTYDWTRCDTAGGNCAVISGTKASSYTLTSADVNHTLRAYVNASNAAGTGTALSAATGVVTATSSSAPPSNSSLPTVSGTAQQGLTLTTTNGTWSGSPTSYTYDWTRCDTAGGNCAVISGTKASSYTLTSADVNHTLRAYVNASNSAGTG